MNTQAFQAACRKEFAFLTSTFGFKEAPSIPNETHDQVAYERQGWKIVVVGMSHGTSAGIHIYSPDEELGMFCHLITPDFEQQERSKFDLGQLGEIEFQACCLQTLGSAFLNGDWENFKILQLKQKEWLTRKGMLKGLSSS